VSSASARVSETSAVAKTSVAVIGAGRLGRVLARALVQAGFEVAGPLGRDEIAPQSDIALLCVPDADVSDAAAAARSRAGLVGHVSGATTLEHVDLSIHPLQTFTGTESPEVFSGIGAAVDGRTPDALAAAEALALALGARPFRVADGDRAEYHAAASLASNLVLTVLDATERLAADAGLTADDARDLFTPLVRRAVENWAERGARDALTGPIVRGDEETVERQRAAIDTAAPDLLPMFDALVARTRTIVDRDLVA